MFKIGEQVKVHWDSPVTTTVIQVEGEEVTIQRGTDRLYGEPVTIHQEVLAKMVK